MYLNVVAIVDRDEVSQCCHFSPRLGPRIITNFEKKKKEIDIDLIISSNVSIIKTSLFTITNFSPYAIFPSRSNHHLSILSKIIDTSPQIRIIDTVDTLRGGILREKDTQIKTKRERERWIKRRVERSSAEGERERGGKRG